ncbi:hypothetical protein Hanom_Chr06g00508701 [Helianthus anomalus]
MVFRDFFVLVWKSPFFTFDRRDIYVSCLRSVPTSSRDKEWKKKFFYIDAGVIPQGALVLAGMSLLWRDSRLYPAFQRVDNGEWSLFDFIDPPPITLL